MSGPQAKPFKGRLGFDANNDKVVNLADPTELQDGLNLRYFIATNTTQTFDPTRTYPAGFIVEYGDRLFKSKTTIAIGAFNLNEWTEIHAFGRWLRVTGAYTADPGDNLYVSTQTASVTVKLPFPAEDGDIVTVVDEGFATTNPIVIDAQTNTINNILGNYSINSQDICQFIYLGGTWKVSREEKSTFQVVGNGDVLKPNSYNLIPSAVSNKTVYLPPNPINGQWVTTVDSTMDGGNYYTNVNGNGKTINGSATFVMNRFGSQVTCVYDSTSGEWKAASNQSERRMVNTLFPPLPSQSLFVPLTAATQSITLPASVTGDWVEVVSTVQDTIAVGALIVTASSGTYFRNNGGTQNTTTYRIKRRGRTLFLLQGNEWSVVQSDALVADQNITSGTLTKNTLVVMTGSASSTISLPASDAVQIGDYVTAQINSSVGRVLVSVQNTGTDLLDSTTTATYATTDAGMIVTFIYRGWNGTKYVWETINHGSAYLKKTQNLADLPDKAVSRTNLDVFSKGESDLRFLPLHGNADTATQAANSDKLDNLDSSDFIQVKNLNVTAVDANTTTETRFTTNTNTPDATMWQVVMFVDTATGNKSQIAMNNTTSQIAYRVYSGSWSGWTRLDQAANSATATKLLNARNIALNGDATGTASFDGTADANISVSGVSASTLKAVAITSDSTTTANTYTKIATVTTGSGATDDASIRFFVNPRKTASGPFALLPSDALLRVKAGTVLSLQYNGTNHELGYVNVSPGVVDVYLKCVQASLISTVHELSRNMPSGNIAWLSNQAVSTTVPSGYAAGSNYKTYNDNYHPLADKLTTARNINLTGGVTGTASFDGSGDISITTSVVPGGTQFEISNVNGLQTALDGKLGSTAKAADSDKLDGLDSLDFKQAISATNATEDPNTTLKPNIMTNHTNTPDGGVTYWFIETQFYQTRSVSSGRFQFATQYNGGTAVQFRNYVSGAWGSWIAVAAIVDGATYNINVTGSAGSATTATKLAAPVNINGVPFDGSTGITIQDGTRLATAGGNMTGPITRTDTPNSIKTFDNVLNYSNGNASVTGTLKIKLPVGMNNTMMTFNVTIYNYTDGGSTTFTISGYNYSAGWSAITANSNDHSLAVYGDSVRFAYDGTNACLLIGTTTSTWGYPKVSVNNVILGHSGAIDSGWSSGSWGVSYLTSETGLTLVGTATVSSPVAKVGRTNTFALPQNFTAAGTYARSVVGNYGVMLYNDGTAWYLMKTASGDQYGSYDATRPFAITLATGAVTLGTAVTMNSTASIAGTLGVTGVATFGSQATFNNGSTNAGWVRSTGAIGWYNDTYGGGINMQDATWVRVYGGKAFYVQNEIAATGNVTAYYSDQRLKENLKVIPNALDTVRSWTGYTYNANVTAQSFGYDPEKKEIGLLAQDVQKTTPEAVEPAPFDRTATKGKSLTGKHYLTLKYDRLVPVLVEAIKEQDKEIQELKGQVAKLLEMFDTLGK